MSDEKPDIPMVPEKPLHVRVAEALGWTDLKPETWDLGGKLYKRDEWGGVLPGDGIASRAWGRIPRYDTDWSVVGPLLVRFGIGVSPAVDVDEAAHASTCIGACSEYCALPEFGRARIKKLRMSPARPFMACAEAATALEAACHLLIALHAAGKLEPRA